MDEVGRAYAALGLAVGAPRSAIRTRYRALVRTWHPDRFQGDPQAVAEATARMRLLNRAYGILLRQRWGRGAGDGVPKSAPVAAEAPRLSREEIEAMVEAVRSVRETRLDRWLGRIGWAAGAAWHLWWIAIPLAFAPARLCYLVWKGKWDELGSSPRLLFWAGGFVVILLLALVGWVQELARRRKLKSIGEEEELPAELAP